MAFVWTQLLEVVSYIWIRKINLLIYRVGRKKMNKIFNFNLGCLGVIIRRFLTHPMLCDCDIEEICWLLFCILKWFCRETISSESFCSSSRGTQSKWSRKLRRSHTTVYAIEKCKDDGEDVNRRAKSYTMDRCYTWIDVIGTNIFNNDQ